MALLRRELMPGKLCWAPESTEAPAGFNGEFVQALELCRPPSAKGGETLAALYSVTHYTIHAAGRAFGPLGLDVVLRFCRNLQAKLDSGSEGGVTIGTKPKDKNERTNACLLVGAYLVVSYAMSAEQIASLFGPGDAELGFVCSWSRVDKPEPKHNLLVKDCWIALELGLTKGWLDPTCLESDEKTEQFCARWFDFVRIYDSSWIIPGLILVGSDPITTALDPNPVTFTNMYPQEDASSDRELQYTEISTGKSDKNMSLDPTCLTDASTRTLTSPAARSISSGQTGFSSVDTVCKEYHAGTNPIMTESNEVFDFVSFLRSCGVTHTIRTNFNGEPGMPKQGSYDAAKIQNFGFSHADVLIVDTHGGLPKSADIAKVLEVCPGEDDLGSAVFVHCKGGFGRSIVLACCLAIDLLDIPGSALLGWVRMVRPGSVNTPQQEQLLQSLRGRNDVRRYAGLAAGGDGAGGVNPKCGCIMQ